jgi:chorismate mutase
MDKYNSFINQLDNDIIYFLSIRQKYKLNSKNFKVYELGGYNTEDILISNLDNNIYINELKKRDFNDTLKQYEKVFNQDLFKQNNKNIINLEELNLNRIIKQCYITLLYDLCDFGDDQYYETTCNLDIQILYKLSQRIHFGYELIKFKYLNNKEFYNKLLTSNNTSLTHYYLSEPIKEPTYLENIAKICSINSINHVLIQSFYKFYILPFTTEIQFSFLQKLKHI